MNIKYAFLVGLLLSLACGSEDTDVEYGDAEQEIAVGCDRPYLCDNPHTERPWCNVTWQLRPWTCYAQCEPCE